MGLRCQPGQMAWIDVPRNERNLIVGLVQLHGRVIRVSELASSSPIEDPHWLFEPKQVVQSTTGFQHFVNGVDKGQVPPGTKFVVGALPDAWLRPFKDFDPDELVQLRQELES